VGQSSTTVTVTPKDDAIVDPDETVILTLASSAIYTVGAGGSASITIIDNDAPVGGFSAKINFQPATAPVPAGYSVDSGLVYGNRGNGWTYGWKSDLSIQTRDRDLKLSPDQRYDSLVQTGDASSTVWEIAVPNGQYQVHIVSGDPKYLDSVYKINVEGVLLINGTPTSSAHWIENTANVTVSDERLTITNASGAVNNKINFIDITSIGSGPALPQVTVAATDNSAAEQNLDPGVFTLTRSGDTSKSLTVNFTLGGSATNGSDYDLLPLSVIIPAGQASATVTVTPKDDTIVDPNENVILTLSSSANYTIGASSNASITIADNDKQSNLFSAQINFQPAAVPVPAGYLVDSGAVFGAKGSLQYGWSSDASAVARDRDSVLSLDQRYDTLVHMQYGGINRFWDLAVPNGTYQVHLVAGDANYFTGNIYKISVEGTLAINATPTSASRWAENTVTVTVTDGRLTINNAAGAANNRICFVDVTQLS
jgi:hypothetical protein